MSFLSDTAAPAHPAVIEALAAVNAGPAPSYGADDASARVRAALRDVFECELEVWLVGSGTAANALALSLICGPDGAIACHREAHIERDERGAPEFFTGGGKLSLLDGEHGRIDPARLADRLAGNHPEFVHETPLHALSISNLNECGEAYRPEEVAELAGRSRAAGLFVHVDGARFANAVAGLECAPAALSWRAGVDVLSLGFTKTGAVGCEAVVLFGRAMALKDKLLQRAKRGGHMPPKMRYLAAQAEAMLKDDLWLQLAASANASARNLALALFRAGGGIDHNVAGNEVFARLRPRQAKALERVGAQFYRWHDGSLRFVCSWVTTEAEIAAAAAALSPVNRGLTGATEARPASSEPATPEDQRR
jgi:threonine aldolase